MAEPWELATPRSVTETPEDLAIRGVPTAGADPWDIINRQLDRATRHPGERPLSQQEFEERYPSRLTRTGAGLRYSAQGVPVVGNLISSTRASRDFARTYPTTGAIGRFGAGAATFTGAGRLTQAGTVGASNLIRRLFQGPMAATRRNPGLVADVAGQGALGAGTFIADRQTSDSPLTGAEDTGITGAIGGTAGVLSPLTRRVFAPSGIGRGPRFRRGRLDYSPEDQSLVDLLIRTDRPRFEAQINAMTDRLFRRQTAGRAVTDDDIASGLANILRTERGRALASTAGERIGRFGAPVAGAIAGHLTVPGLGGLFLGGAAGEGVRRGARRYAASRFGQRHLGSQFSPNTAATVDSIIPSMLLEAIRPERTYNDPPDRTLMGR